MTGLEHTASTDPRHQEPFYLVFRDVIRYYFLTLSLAVNADNKGVCEDFKLTNAVRGQFTDLRLLFPFAGKVWNIQGQYMNTSNLHDFLLYYCFEYAKIKSDFRFCFYFT